MIGTNLLGFSYLFLGMCSLFFGWFLIRSEVSRRRTALGAFATGISGVSLLFCAQWFLFRFLDFIR